MTNNQVSKLSVKQCITIDVFQMDRKLKTITIPQHFVEWTYILVCHIYHTCQPNLFQDRLPNLS